MIKEVQVINNLKPSEVKEMFRFCFMKKNNAPCVEVTDSCKKWIHDMPQDHYQAYLDGIPEMIRQTFEHYRPKNLN